MEPFISREEYLKGYDKEYPLDAEQEVNLIILLSKIEDLSKIMRKSFRINSGYRPRPYNEKIGGSKNSLHIYCAAVDLADPVGFIDGFLVEKSFLLEELDLYMEHPKWTKGWCHLQIKPVPSGSRIFIPTIREPIRSKFDKEFKDLMPLPSRSLYE